MEAPHNNIWGPHLWMILHSTAERIGLKGNPLEEKRIWIGLLSSLRYSLPCPQCKKHYSVYYLSHPVNGSNRDIRMWLYHLHSEVNNRNEKPSIEVEELEVYCNPFHFSYHYSFVVDHMNRALRLGWSNRNDTQRTFRFLNELKCFYDLF